MNKHILGIGSAVTPDHLQEAQDFYAQTRPEFQSASSIMVETAQAALNMSAENKVDLVVSGYLLPVADTDHPAPTDPTLVKYIEQLRGCEDNTMRHRLWMEVMAHTVGTILTQHPDAHAVLLPYRRSDVNWVRGLESRGFAGTQDRVFSFGDNFNSIVPLREYLDNRKRGRNRGGSNWSDFDEDASVPGRGSWAFYED